jgi:hypothetical protein
MKKSLLSMVCLALLAGPMAANAIIVTFDDLHLTVERPLSGSTFVDFFATVTLEPGESLIGAALSHPCLAPAECLLSTFAPTTFDEGHAARFFTMVDSTNLTGLYDTGVGSSFFWYTDAAGQERYTETFRYTVNVVDATSVPEPGTLALFGLGFAGLGFARRRRATN